MKTKLHCFKTRFFMLLGAIPIVIFLSWKLAISQTVESYGELRQLEANIRKYADPERTIATLQSQLTGIQETSIANPNEVDDQLIDAISNNMGKFNINLEEFPETHLFESNNYMVQTFRLTFSGKFANLLSFIHYAEYEITSCHIVSVAFHRKELRKTGEKLFVDIYFQSVYRNM